MSKRLSKSRTTSQRLLDNHPLMGDRKENECVICRKRTELVYVLPTVGVCQASFCHWVFNIGSMSVTLHNREGRA